MFEKSRNMLPAFFILTGFFASACTAILVPDEDDDGVKRCDNSEECDDTGDNRFEAVCVYGEGQDEGSQKVCAVQYTEPSCNVDAFVLDDHVFSTTYEEALDALGTGYPGCNGEGGKGCATNGTCDSGFEPNGYGVCDDGDGLPAVAVSAETIGQDVLDQFCRYRFCDKNFVCDTTGTPICVPCDANKPFGEGGCGELYSGPNTRSSIYLAANTDEGSCGNHDADGTKFGDVPSAPDP
jgi:hypothetical protein